MARESADDYQHMRGQAIEVGKRQAVFELLKSVN